MPLPDSVSLKKSVQMSTSFMKVTYQISRSYNQRFGQTTKKGMLPLLTLPRLNCQKYHQDSAKLQVPRFSVRPLRNFQNRRSFQNPICTDVYSCFRIKVPNLMFQKTAII